MEQNKWAAFGNRIKTLRENEGVSLTSLAEKIGVTRQSLSKYENGVHSPDVDVIKKIAEHFGCSTDYLIGLSDKPTREYEALSSVPYMQELLTSLQNLAEDERQYLAEAYADVTEVMALGKANPQRRFFVKYMGKLISGCAEFIEVVGENSEGSQKKSDEDNLSANELAEMHAKTLRSFGYVRVICEKLWNGGIEALLNFSESARKAYALRPIREDENGSSKDLTTTFRRLQKAEKGNETVNEQ